MKKIGKLVFVAPKISGGGAERVVSVLSSSLADLNYQVDLILYERKEDEYPLSSKVNTHLLPSRRKGQSKVNYLLNKYLYLRNLLKKIRPDVLIPFLPYQVEQCFAASIGLGIPFVVTVRNNPQFDTPNEKMRKRRDWIAKHADAVFLQNKEQMSYFDADIQKKCFVVANPIQDAVLNSTYLNREKTRNIVTMGRLEAQKNQKLLIRAFSKVHQKHPEMKLDIYGQGSKESELQELVNELDMQESITLCGRTNNAIKTLNQYDLFILSSDYEGMPNALMEAMGIGIPCISTNCPTGPEELIGNQNERGILVPTNNEIAMIEAILFAVSSGEDMRHKSDLAKEYIRENFSSVVIAERFIEKIETVINKKWFPKDD